MRKDRKQRRKKRKIFTKSKGDEQKQGRVVKL
jgi:hypothetical protein